MSNEKYNYLGPYITIIPKVTTITRNTSSLRCSLGHSSFNLKAKFCTECGGEIYKHYEEVTEPYKKFKEVIYDEDTYVDELFLINDNTLISNHPIRPKYHRDTENITPQLIEDDMAWFKEQFKYVLAALKPHAETIEYKWGLLEYYN
jgi:hypothetical protein